MIRNLVKDKSYIILYHNVDRKLIALSKEIMCGVARARVNISVRDEVWRSVIPMKERVNNRTRDGK